jgi:putative transposase
VLPIRDTSDINLNGHKKTEGLGYCGEHVLGVKIHSCIKIPPRPGVAKFVGYLKGKSALMIFDKYPQQRKGDRHFWARGYYVDTVGLNEEQIKRYIKG